MPLRLRSLLFFLAIPCLSSPILGQTPPRDARALTVIQQSLAAMGGTVPPGSLAIGTVHLVEGSLEETGTIRILTRGANQSREEFRTGRGLQGRVYSSGLAASLFDHGAYPVSLELAATSQSSCFPLVLIAGAFNNPDFAFEYVGEENQNGILTHRIRFWNTFASDPKLQPLADLTVKDLWIDAATALPRKLSYEEQDARGHAARFANGAIYSDYRNIGGIIYPFLIERIFNGTPWATIRIENVSLSPTLSDSDFDVRGGGA